LSTARNASCGTSTAPTCFIRLLARLLLLEQLALASDIAAVALREHVLPLRFHGLARDHARPDRSLDRDVEVLPGNLLPQALDKRLAARYAPSR